METVDADILQGFLYKMRLVYAHFPINAIPGGDGTTLQIRNFCEWSYLALAARSAFCTVADLFTSGREDRPGLSHARRRQSLFIGCQG